MKRLRCEGCGRPLALTPYSYNRPKYYCSELCTVMPPVRENEERDGLILGLWAAGYSSTKLAKLFGISGQRVRQILGRDRNDPGYQNSESGK